MSADDQASGELGSAELGSADLGRADSSGRVYFVVPEAVADPARISGGNVYDLALRDGLSALGWDVRMPSVASSEAEMASALSRLPDDAVVLIDGLLAGVAPDALVQDSGRLLVVVLAHMVAATVAERDAAEVAARERRAFDAARRVVTTSGWTRRELLAQGIGDQHRIVVARPGTDRSPAATASSAGGRLLCVGVIAPHKGQDLLLRALAGLDERLDWTCTLVGSLEVDQGFAAELEALVSSTGLAGRIRFAGALGRDELEDVYANTDLLVAPSRAESYGMAAAEALAHGIPVLATRVGGLPEAVERSGAGILVPPEDPWALRVVLEQWCTDPARRHALKSEAVQGMATSSTWQDTARIVASVLTDVVTDSVPAAPQGASGV